MGTHPVLRLQPIAWFLLPALITAELAWAQAGVVDSSSAETREELLRQLRMTKQHGARVTYQAGVLERSLLAFEKARTPRFVDLNLYGLYPRISTLEHGPDLGFGVRFWQPDIVGPIDVQASSQLSIQGYEYYDLQLGKLPHRGGSLPQRSWRGDNLYELGSPGPQSSSRLNLYVSLRYRHRPLENFFGLGPQSRREDRASFLLYDATYDLNTGLRVRPWLAFTVRTGYLTFGVGDGRDEDVPTISETFDESTAPGLTQQPDYLHVSPQILLDFRDVPGNPHRGAMLGVEYGFFDDRGGDAYRFNLWALDARAYVPLLSAQRVLAFRALYFDSVTGDGSRVPFYMQETLGGSHTLRGFDSFRFRGGDVLVTQAEYRWEGSPAIELALFTDAGTVSEEGKSVDLGDLEWDVGYGVRFKTYRQVMFRFDQAWSDERWRTLIRFSASY